MHVIFDFEYIPKTQAESVYLLPNLLSTLTSITNNTELAQSFAAALLSEDPQSIRTQLAQLRQYIPQSLSETELISKLHPHWQKQIETVLRTYESKDKLFQEIKRKHHDNIHEIKLNENDSAQHLRKH